MSLQLGKYFRALKEAASGVRPFGGRAGGGRAPVKFPESKLAHMLLDGLKGVEIGASAHNPFGLDTINVNLTDGETVFKEEERSFCGETVRVDLVAAGDALPLTDASVDFVLSSHVLEHFIDPIKALKEWHRVVKKGGYIFMIIPHKERTFDKHRARTTLAELIDRHEHGTVPEKYREHYSVWITADIVELSKWLGWKVVWVQDVDDKVGNGFTVVVKK